MRALTILISVAVVAIGAYGARQSGVLDGFWPSSPDLSMPAVDQPSTSIAPRNDSAIRSNGVMQTVTERNIAQNQTTPSTSSPPTKAQPAVDETALRYFASKGDTKRLQAEIARLKALYPEWTPPADPLAVQPVGDAELDRMWKLYSDGKLAELRQAIADRQLKQAGWTPPGDLLDRLAVAEAREQLINASNLKQYETVVRVATNTPSLLTCAEVDVLWRVAEAFARTDRQKRATDAYSYVLTNCPNPEERLATVQKALPLLSREELDKLLAQEKTGPNGAGEFASIRGDLARKSVAAGGANPKLTVDPADLATVEKLAQDEGLASDQLLLGWYNVRRNNAKAAEEWFRKARDTKNTAESSQGLALALVAQSRFSEAEDLLYPWQDASDEVRAVYLAATANLLGIDPPVPIAVDVLQRIVPVIYEARDAANAQQLGWYALALNQFQTAAQWFSTALSWKPDDEPSAYGLVLTRFRVGDRAGVSEIQHAWQGRSERIARLGETSTPPRTPAISPNFSAPTSVAPGTYAPIQNMPDQMRFQPAPAPAQTVPAETSNVVTAPQPRVQAAPGSMPQQYVQQPAAPHGALRARQQTRNTSENAAPARGCTSSIPPESLSPQAALNRGWCLMEMNRPLEAAPAFEVALKSSSAKIREDAAYGQSLAYLRVGLSREAAVAATKAPQNRQRTTELRTAILANQATDSFEAGRYVETLLALDERARIAPERIDLMTLRGYAYLKLGRLGDAEGVFEAVAATGSREGARGLAAISALRDPQGGG
jgi:tetratricopeptide (TPR) repeat protein